MLNDWCVAIIYEYVKKIWNVFQLYLKFQYHNYYKLMKTYKN